MIDAIYIGYDPKESIAYDVCRYSLIRVGFPSDKIKKLYSKNIPEYNRSVKNELQSTDFTFTRFLVPYLSGYKGWSLYCDSDFLFCKNPVDMMKQVNIEDKHVGVWVVQHPEYVPKSSKKMNNLPQHTQYRKNWASLMLFNNENLHVKASLTSNYVNTVVPGRLLHTFEWLREGEVGSLPLEWNCLDGYYHLSDPAAIHYTDGGPWHGYRDTHYADQWIRVHREMLAQKPAFGELTWSERPARNLV